MLRRVDLALIQAVCLGGLDQYSATGVNGKISAPASACDEGLALARYRPV